MKIVINLNMSLTINVIIIVLPEQKTMEIIDVYSFMINALNVQVKLIQEIYVQNVMLIITQKKMIQEIQGTLWIVIKIQMVFI